MKTIICSLFLISLWIRIAKSLQCNNIKPTKRVDCFPEPFATEEKCLRRGCCWEPAKRTYMLNNIQIAEPWCHYPSDFPTYRVVNGEYIPNGYIGSLEKSQSTFRPNEILKLHINVTFDTRQRLRVKITDPNVDRFEVPVILRQGKKSKEFNEDDTHDYEFFVNKDPFYMKVYRKSTKKLIFDTSVGPLIFSDQYIEFSTLLVNNYYYGMGEHQDRFAHPADWTSFTMWNRDVPPGVGRNLYGDHPFYMSVEDSENAMGFFFLNSNGMDINVQPDPSLTFITIGGIIDFYIYMGPTPRDVIRQHTDVIGKSFLPPYFALGFHLCRWKYNTNENLKKIIERNRMAKMPYDVQWVDIDSMDQCLDWTYDNQRLSELPQIVNDLHQHGQHYINIIDPAISDKEGYEPYETGIKNNVFIKNVDNDEPVKGAVWPGTTVFPDFTNPNTSLWWKQMATKFHQKIPYDGIWIDMNEPSSFVDGSDRGCPSDNPYDNPPYIPRVLDGQLYDKTLCPSSRQYLSSHYNLHNMYGHFEAIATYDALKSIRDTKRPFVLTRSTFAGTGQYAAHWSGDNDANWQDMFYSIPNMLNFNLFGVSMVGSDICGFSSDTTEELCIRWMQLGAFYPFMRNHNNDVAKDQDPAAFSLQAQEIIRNALLTRYTLLPYLYNLFYLSHTRGDTVVRPLLFEFLADKNTHLIDRQFMFGPAFLISPCLEQGATSVKAYFPSDTWYRYDTGELIKANGSYVTLDAPLEMINVHVRGGFIVPYQFPSVTTVESRANPFGILVALKQQADGSSRAVGEMFWDDGESIDSVEQVKYNTFKFESEQTSKSGMLTISCKEFGYNTTMNLGEIKVYGVISVPRQVQINSVDHGQYEYIDSVRVLHISYSGPRLDEEQPINVSWIF